MKFNNETLRDAVKQWLNDASSAEATYGHISDWDTTEVTDMSKLFLDAHTFNENLNNWNVSNVTNMNAMFDNAYLFDQPLDNWDVGNVTNMSEMFSSMESLTFNQPIGNWDVSNVTNMGYMFSSAISFNQDLSSWNVSKVTNMEAIFGDTESYNQPIKNWNVSNVTDMNSMFRGAKSFNQPIGNWDVSNVTSMFHMFYEAKAFNQPLKDWDVSNVTSMHEMFEGATSFKQDIDNWSINEMVSLMDSSINDFMKFLEENEDEDEKVELSIDTSNIPESPIKFDDLEAETKQRVENQTLFVNADGSINDLIETFGGIENKMNMAVNFANTVFSDLPKNSDIVELCDKDWVNFKNHSKSCIKAYLKIPSKLKKHMEVLKYDIDVSNAFSRGANCLIMDIECEVTFNIKTTIEETKEIINKYQDNNYDLRWDLAIHWKDISDNNQYSFDSWDDSMIEELIEEEPNWFED